MTQYARFHPIILSATEVAASPSKFKIIERPFSLVPIKISYFAERSDTNNKFKYDITGIILTKVVMTYRFEEIADNETRVDWRVDIDSKLPIEKWLAGKMLRAQHALIDNIINARPRGVSAG